MKQPEYLVLNPIHSKLYTNRKPFKYSYELIPRTNFFNEIIWERIKVSNPLIIKKKIKDITNIKNYLLIS